MQIKNVMWGIILLMILTACQRNHTNEENFDKLLERQAEIQDAKEVSVDRLEVIKDSLESERRALLEQRDSKDRRINRMEENQKLLADKLKKEQLEKVSKEKGEMQEGLAMYLDSVASLKKELTLLENLLDSLRYNLQLYGAQEVRTNETLNTGISEIDQRMNGWEKRKQQEQKHMNLLKNRIRVADKKIEAYELERQMYVDESDELLRSMASEKEIIPVRSRIEYLDSVLVVQRSNKTQLQDKVAQSETFITRTDARMKDLQNKIRNEYFKQDVIESFIESEKERLGGELEQLKESREDLIAEQNEITGNLSATENRIKQLSNDMELIRNRKLKEILEARAEYEKSDSSLAQEEVHLFDTILAQVPLAQAPLAGMLAGTTGRELQTVAEMERQLDSMKNLIRNEKAAIAAAKQEISEQKAETADRKAKLGKVVSRALFVLVLLGIVMAGVFYFLGRRTRQVS